MGVTGAVTEGVTSGVTVGVTGVVTTGVTGEATAGVIAGVILGVRLGVRWLAEFRLCFPHHSPGGQLPTTALNDAAEAWVGCERSWVQFPLGIPVVSTEAEKPLGTSPR
jgi:hypothetical protein